MTTNSHTGPILVKAAVPADQLPEDIPVDQPVTPPNLPLSVSLSEDLLTAITDNTVDLQDRLDKFVNGLTAKIQSVSPHFFVLGLIEES